MRGVVLLGLAGTAVAYVLLTLSDWALLIGFGACAAVLLACLMAQLSGRRWSGGGDGGGRAHKNSLTLIAEIVGIIGFLIALMTLMK